MQVSISIYLQMEGNACPFCGCRMLLFRCRKHVESEPCSFVSFRVLVTASCKTQFEPSHALVIHEFFVAAAFPVRLSTRTLGIIAVEAFLQPAQETLWDWRNVEERFLRNCSMSCGRIRAIAFLGLVESGAIAVR
jgi:hypothetical protein